MSLINQVLKDLDKRGASSNVGESTIRVVHGHSNRNAAWLVVAGAVGMFMLGSSGWMFWQSQHVPFATKNEAVPAKVEVQTNTPIVVAPVSILPSVVSVSPSPLLAVGSPQTVTLNGLNFKAGASVTLRDEAGNVYEDRPIMGMTQEQITLKLNFGSNPGTWWVEVRNPDQSSSGQFALVVNSSKGMQQIKPLVAGLPPVNAAKPQSNLENNALLHAPADGAVNKLPTQSTLEQQAENEFRNAYQLMRQGHNSEALAGFESALKLNPAHEQARQTLVSILLEKKRNEEAEIALEAGLKINVQQINFAMLLARLQVERNALQAALDTLLRTLPYADLQPSYQSFVAALMQRQNRHKEAISYYQKALQLKPNLGVWLMGLGISLRAEQRKEEARSAFKQALETNSLNTELQSFVNQQLKEL